MEFLQKTVPVSFVPSLLSMPQSSTGTHHGLGKWLGYFGLQDADEKLNDHVCGHEAEKWFFVILHPDIILQSTLHNVYIDKVLF